ncbi:MAG: hypothetical protein QOG03_2337 [Actinomycetota bacterium]|nr:hypothetical protein [Actinomycetota bacterium]
MTRLAWTRPGGAELFRDVSFRVGDGEHVALVGANGVGKTTLVRLLSGDEPAPLGSLRVEGRLGVMRQFIGSIADGSTVRDLLVSLAPDVVRRAALVLDAVDPADGVRYATALSAWGDAGGYEAEVFWDRCTTRALRLPFDECGHRPVSTLSGGEQKRLASAALLDGDFDVLILDEPDNYLDVPSKRELESALSACPKTILYVSHDRELLANTSTKVVTLEAGGAWTHGASFASWHDARSARLDRLDEQHRRWQEERARLVASMKEMKRRAAISDANASRARAAETKVRHFDEAGPPIERPKDQSVAMRLGGGRTGKRVVMAEALELVGLTNPFDLEVWFGERVAVLGPNGSGKSHFLRLLSGGAVDHAGSWTLGARVVPGHFSQTHEHPELVGRRLVEVLAARDLARGPAMGRLRRYELDGCAEQPFETLSGGQQARFQILLLELDGATLLLLDEPTDNLDLASAEALEEALSVFEGTVLAVTHDRWFMRGFDRFVVFAYDGSVTEVDSPDAALV